MLKKLFFAAGVSLFAVLACRNDDSGLQKIDQVVHLYIDSAGQDMLNSSITGSYKSVTLNDLYGTTDNATAPHAMKKDADTVRYIEYVAGAKRRLIDSSDVSNKIYQSKISLNFSVRKPDSTFTTYHDTLVLNYRNSPDIFQLKEAFYNGEPVFTKVEGQPNIIKIHK